MCVNTPTELKKLVITFTWQWKGPVIAKLPDVGLIIKLQELRQGGQGRASETAQPTARSPQPGPPPAFHTAHELRMVTFHFLKHLKKYLKNNTL